MDDYAALSSHSRAEDHQKLGEEITLLAGQINAANFRLIKLIAKFDESKGWCDDGTIRSCAHWLNWKCGIALGAAREKVRVSHCLENLPKIDAAFETGAISYSKVRAMTRAATPENEDYLLMIAHYGTASHVEQVVGKYRKVTASDDDRSEIDQELSRKLVYYQEEDGSWIIHAKLPAEVGSLVVKAIEALAIPVQQELQQETMEKKRNTPKEKPESKVEEDVSAETFSDNESDSEVQALDVDDSNAEEQSYAHSRADALVTMAEHFLATSDQNTGLKSLKGSERCQIVLHVDVNTLRTQGDTTYRGQGHCNLDDKHWISPNTAKRLSCDASLVTVLEDERGKVLNIGRKSRIVPASIKRALSLRDKTCTVPGCCQSRNLDAHHIKHWVDGGETSLDNLVHLCRTHHTQLHRGYFTLHVEKSETTQEPQMVFSTPSGQCISTSFFPQFPGLSVRAAEEALRSAAPNVDANTGVTRWRGESCDYAMAVEGLLQRDRQLDRFTPLPC